MEMDLKSFRFIVRFLKRKMLFIAMGDPISKELLEILACPVCKSDLAYNKDKSGLHCGKCDHTYPIKEGIPVLLPPEEKK